MNLIDTHCHPQFPQYDGDRDDVIRHTLDGGVKMICVGTDLEMSEKAVKLAEKYDGIWAAVGLHPDEGLDREFDIGPYKKLAQEKKVVAIGEAGLDYYRTTEPKKHEIQKDRFRQQIMLAKELNKPVILHYRQSQDDVLEILKDNPISGVAHSFSGTPEVAQKFFDLGFYIGFNGIVTFTTQYDKTVISAPLDKILLETDAPLLAPVPYRGKRNEPLYMVEVAKKIAELKKISVEEVAEQTVKNANKLFGLND